MKKQQNFGSAGGKFYALLFAGDPFPGPSRSNACGMVITQLRVVQAPEPVHGCSGVRGSMLILKDRRLKMSGHSPPMLCSWVAHGGVLPASSTCR